MESENVQPICTDSEQLNKNNKYRGYIKNYVRAKIMDPELTVARFCDQSGVPLSKFAARLVRHPKVAEIILREHRKRLQAVSLSADLELARAIEKGNVKAIELFYRRHENWLAESQHGDNITIIVQQGLLPSGKQAQRVVFKAGKTIINQAGDEIPLLPEVETP